ncbi:hypothetical protein ACS0TY_025115 [Phlomoides rotata]
MLIRNIDQKSGMCNGTRLIVKRLGNHIIEEHIISGRNIGNKIFIPRMTLTNADQTLPMNFNRRQFLIILSFAMTINKSKVNNCQQYVCICLDQCSHIDNYM